MKFFILIPLFFISFFTVGQTSDDYVKTDFKDSTLLKKKVEITLKNNKKHIGVLWKHTDSIVVLVSKQGQTKFNTIDVASIILYEDTPEGVKNKKVYTLKKNAISFNIAGNSPLIGIIFETLLTSKVSVEVGFGLISVGGGVKYYPFETSLKTANLYIGFSSTYFAVPMVQAANINYIPFGFAFFGRKGLNFCFDLGPAAYILAHPYGSQKNWRYERIYFYGGLKLGFRF